MKQKLITINAYNLVCHSETKPTDEQIQEELLSQYERQQWLRRRMRSPMGEPWKSWSKKEGS